ncbi:hypothetical protein [Kytococcus schroeteri]|uniref:Uncharacterized protein n=2 Tax=Kytococcus TaxID=57499 RepID=A0A2I1PDL0_9MICO|nr:hypothetical protein [Kytococcus schroeteri]PKZ42709.1 hypothetical protein CYJ76_00125 [Kytococcus schroeteri]
MTARDLDPTALVRAVGAGTLVALLVLAVGAVLLWRARAAGRAREAHARIEASRAALDAALMRRALAAREFASIGCLDPASAVIVLRTVGDVLDACDAAGPGEVMGPDRLEAEEHLTEALRRAFHQRHGSGGASGGELGPQRLAAKQALARASERVHAQRLHHNEEVRATRHIVDGRTARLLGLSRGVSRPEPLEVEDDVPYLRSADGERDVD